MQRKALMGMAAVAGIALLLYIRRKGASDDAASTSGVLTSNAALINAAMGNVWGGSSAPASAPAPAPVADVRVVSPAPAQSSAGKFTAGGPNEGPAAREMPLGQYNYVAESSGGGYHYGAVTDAGRIAELDGVRNFVGGRDLFDSGVLGDIVSAAQGQGMGYWETMRTLGEAYSLTPNQVSQHMSQYGGVAQW